MKDTLRKIKFGHNSARALKERAKEVDPVIKLVSENISELIGDPIKSIYLNGLKCYKDGSDWASIYYGSLAVELALLIKVKEKMTSSHP